MDGTEFGFCHMAFLNDLSYHLSQKETDPVRIMEKTLSTIREKNPEYYAFIHVDEDLMMQKAQESQKRREAGKALSDLDGIPIGIKDNILRKGEVAECASRILAGFRSPYSATVIEKLERAGMIPVGRTNMDEFAMGSSTENSALGITHNGVDKEYAPGGSSGGSAVAVATGMLPVALGSDTGGSIRQPASFNGVVGLKPTYGSVSRYGLVAFASSLDQIGPFAKTVEDAQIIYDIISGYDPRDTTSVQPELKEKMEDELRKYPPEKMKIAIPENLLENVSGEVKKSFFQVVDFLEREILENKIDRIRMEASELSTPVYYITATSEASANLARFDGIRYGKREAGDSLISVYENSRTKGFGKEVKRRILLGTYALSSGYYDAYYGKAQKVRAMIHREYMEIFRKYDAVLMPVAPDVPFKLGEKIHDPVSMYLADVLTTGASLAGIPALSVPGPAERLPIGVQIQGTFFSENSLFALGKIIEKKFSAG